jgi:sporulation protein YlmC with PRC-barrel domain
MNRLLATTAIGLLLGLTPALAQDAADQPQSPPAMQDPAQPSEAIPAEPMKPAVPLPDQSSQSEDIPGQSSQAMPAAPDEAAPPTQSSQAPESTMPAHPEESADANSASPKFLSRQDSSDLLASNLIGQSVYNSQDETVGDINDLVTDQTGKVIAVLVGTGGFLGIGEKDVALSFNDLRFSQDQDGKVKIIANVTKETLASAPDYQTLAEQKVTVGENKGDREDQSE